jgi:hypothetical protein
MSAGYTVRIRGAGVAYREYTCPEHGVIELLVELATSGDPRPCPTCGVASERTVTAPRLNIPLGTVQRGRYEASDHPMAMDTRPLADGMPLHEWKAERQKKWDAFDRAEMKKGGLIP